MKIGTGLRALHAWIVAKLQQSSHDDPQRLKDFLSRLVPEGGILAYIKDVNFMPWGTRFKLREDDAILAKLAQCDLYELGYFLEVFSAEATVRGNGPKSSNFGMPLDYTAMKKYIDHISTWLKHSHPGYACNVQWKHM